MEEANSWRNPVDLVSILEATFDRLQEIEVQLEGGTDSCPDSAELVAVLHGDDAQAIAASLFTALEEGCSAPRLALRGSRRSTATRGSS